MVMITMMNEITKIAVMFSFGDDNGNDEDDNGNYYEANDDDNKQ